MGLAAGARLGPYEIVAPLGAGGMGEVYRARDTRLGREVAVKVLPEGFAGSESVRARFEREAKSISALNHPNVCTLHDVGQDGGRMFLVMEMIDGESLGARLAKGPLPLEQVLRLGVEIASGIDAAHRQGIVHRDLKPDNVMLTRSGAKILDFGLAKPGSERAAPIESLTSLPTEQKAPGDQRPLTQEGTILGTFQYMAPEQLEGQEADARTDIFALGAVLYEMATGRRAFQGKNRTSLIAAIVSAQPAPIASILPAAPPALEHVIRRCLEKDPEDRWQSARDVASQLRWISEAGSQAGVPAPIVVRRKTRERLAWTLAGILGVTAAAAVGSRLLETRAGEPPLVLNLVPPDKTVFELEQGNAGTLTISPDGRYVTFLARGEDGRRLLWLRPLDSPTAHPIAGTEDASFPFWSWDGRFIAFFSQGKMRKVDIMGGPPLALCDVGVNPRPGSWNRDDVIIFSVASLDAISRVSASGGIPVAVTKLNQSKGETTHRWASFLPDGRHFLFMAGSHAASGPEANAIYVADLATGEKTLLLQARSNAYYADGHLIYVRENVLVAHPFDAARRVLTGDPVPLVEGVQYSNGFFHGAFSASNDERLVYRIGSGYRGMTLEWFDRQGKSLGIVPSRASDTDTASYSTPALSPDGGRLAIALNDRKTGRDDIWIVDLKRGVSTRFTFDGGTGPCWSPDGRRIVYSRLSEGVLNLYSKPADGEGTEQTLLGGPGHKLATDWSKAGTILGTSFDVSLKRQYDLFTLATTGDPAERPLLGTPAAEREGRFSPDGRWILYDSDESGSDGLYVMPYPGPGGKYQISGDASGTRPYWSQDGHSVYYQKQDGTIMTADLAVRGGALEVGTPRVLFKPPETQFWVPDATGSRFLLARTAEEDRAAPITIMSHWTDRLKR